MRCDKCGGLMVVDSYLNFEGDRNQVWLGHWRCVNCGNTVDPRILKNRLQIHNIRRASSRKKAA